MAPLFLSRRDAGQQLAARLRHLAGRPHVVVLGLPRGGIPVAYEVARGLGASLDVFVVRKIGVPGHEELAMGAVASGGIRVMNAHLLGELGISQSTFDAVTAVELEELARRERAYRDSRPSPQLRDATVVLVDDGVATGSTMSAAVHALRERQPGAIIVAAPVMSQSAQALLARVADRCECLATPEPFHAVGGWYQDFTQTTDAEVRALLAEADARPEVAGLVPPDLAASPSRSGAGQ